MGDKGDSGTLGVMYLWARGVLGDPDRPYKLTYDGVVEVVGYIHKLENRVYDLGLYSESLEADLALLRKELRG